MNGNDYISISEYAELRKCTTSAVYKRMKTTLKKYVVYKDGTRFLLRSILDDEGLNEVSLTPPQPSSSTPPQPSTQRASEEVIRDTESKIVVLLEKQIDDLKEQLRKQEEKAKEEIDFLRKQIEIKDIQIDQQQRLNAMTLEQNKSLTEPKEESIIDNNKRGIFSWIHR